jgi:hypothetical protein
MILALLALAFLAGVVAYRALVLIRLRRWVDGALDAESIHDRTWTAIRVRQAIIRTRRWS